MQTVKFGNVPVGTGHPTLFMAEIGLYFNQDIGQARETIAQLRDFGVRVVKGEVLHDADIVLDDGFMLQYQTHAGKTAEKYRALVERKVMPLSTWRSLYRICADANLPFVVSSYDVKTIDFLVDIGAAAIKLASNNISHLPLVVHAARSKLPVYIDSGKSAFADVDLAVRTLRDNGCEQIVINHNPDGHPSPPEDHNLRIIESYKRMYECPVGLSCHYVGTEVLYTSIGLGYDILEKPVVPDVKVQEWGTPWAMNLGDVPNVLKRVDDCWQALGHTYRVKRYADSDQPARMGLVAAKAIAVGERLSLDNVRFAWPNHGIVSRDWDRVKNAQVAKALKSGEPITWNHVGLDTAS